MSSQDAIAKPKRVKRPTIRERAAEPICPNCGTMIEGHQSKVFCTIKCRTEHQNRRTARGAAIAGWAMAWRADRGSGEIAKAAFEQLCQIVDGFNAEDAAAKPPRPRADLWAAKSLATGFLYIDRKRS
jgi:hypothetical protein